MTNHPNRNPRRPSPARNPSPEEIRAWRLAAGLTQGEAAALGHWGLVTWQQWEAGTRRMHPAFWELCHLKVPSAGL